MNSKPTVKPSKKRLLTTAIALILLLTVVASYALWNSEEEKAQPEEMPTFTPDTDIALDAEKALELLSTQVNKGLDSIKKNSDEK